MYSACFGMCGTFYVCLIVFVVVVVHVMYAVVRIVHTPCMYSACFGMCGTFYVCLIVFVVVRVMHDLVFIVHLHVCIYCVLWFV